MSDRSESWMQDSSMKKLNRLGLFDGIKQHLHRMHGLSEQTAGTLMPLISDLTDQLLYDVLSEEKR